MVRHEHWAKEYRDKPYLRNLSETDFIEHAVKIIKTMAPHFFKGMKELPHESAAVLMMGYGHVIEEAKYRRLDVKKIMSRVGSLDDQ